MNGHGRYVLLQPLRGVLALGVVLHHAAQLDMGSKMARVVLFFVLSGYCVFNAASRYDDGGLPNAGVFLWRRFLRLWPALACAMVYVLLLDWLGWRNRPASASAYLHSASFTSWIPAIGDAIRPWQNPELVVRTHWTLDYEVQFYLLIGGAVVLARVLTCAAKRCLLVLATLLTVSGLMYNLVSPARLTGTLLDYAAYFGIGGLIWAHATRSTPDSRGYRAFMLTATIGVAAYLAWMVWGTAPGLMPNRQTLMFESLLIAMCAGGTLLLLFPLDKRWQRVIAEVPFRRGAAWRTLGLGWRAACGFGTISYSLFLVHSVNAPIARALTERALPAMPAEWVWLSVFCTVQIAMAWLFWVVCERAIPAWGRWVVRRIRAMPACEAGMDLGDARPERAEPGTSPA